jgi:hypothetical protein
MHMLMVAICATVGIRGGIEWIILLVVKVTYFFTVMETTQSWRLSVLFLWDISKPTFVSKTFALDRNRVHDKVLSLFPSSRG